MMPRNTFCLRLVMRMLSPEDEEDEVEVGEFELMAKILAKLKVERYYQENKRWLFVKDDIEFCIDFWPKIPPLLEIEADSEEKVKQGVAFIGLKDIGNVSVKDIYSRYGIDLHKMRELRF